MDEKIALEVSSELQRDAEKEIGPIPTKRGEIPSLELLFKFYKFYTNKSPDDYIDAKSMILMQLCSSSKQHVIKVANVHYDMDFEMFFHKFHEWNKEKHPEEY